MLKGKVAVVTGAGGNRKGDCLKTSETGADIVINDVPGSDYADDTKRD